MQMKLTDSNLSNLVNTNLSTDSLLPLTGRVDQHLGGGGGTAPPRLTWARGVASSLSRSSFCTGLLVLERVGRCLLPGTHSQSKNPLPPGKFPRNTDLFTLGSISGLAVAVAGYIRFVAVYPGSMSFHKVERC